MLTIDDAKPHDLTAAYNAELAAEHVEAVSPWLSAERFSRALGDVHDRGYAVIESVMAKDELDAYREILKRTWPNLRRVGMYLRARKVIAFMPC